MQTRTLVKPLKQPGHVYAASVTLHANIKVHVFPSVCMHVISSIYYALQQTQ